MKKGFYLLIIFSIFCLSLAGILHNRITTRTELREPEGTTGAMQALDFWTRARAYPKNDIPPGKFTRAIAHRKQMLKELPRSVQSNNSWASIGPDNLSGRALSVAVNPQNSNTVYAGSASGGLWCSYTAGLSWQRVETGFPVLGVAAIAIAPNDSNLMYIGTGEVYRYQVAAGGLVIRTTRGSYGIGVLKTTDAGKTWSKSLDWPENVEGGVQCIRLNPLNPNTILAATTDDIYKSTDAGKTWYPTVGSTMAEDILINPLDTTFVIASIGNFSSVGAGLYCSFDAGETWLNLFSIPAYSGKMLFDVYQAHPNVVYASVADSTTYVSSAWQSTDMGISWVRLSSMDVVQVQGWYSHYIAVHPTDSSQVLRGGVNMYKSTDGGRTYYGVGSTYSDHHSFAHDPNNPDIIYDANDDGIYKSTDFGDSYTYASFGMVTGQFYNGFSNSSQDSLLAIGQVQDHIPGYSYTGSKIWGRTAVDECGWTAIDPTNDQVMYAIDRNGGNVYRTSTRLGPFSPVFNNTVAFGAWNTPAILAPSNPSTIYFAKNLVYKSTNGGSNWTTTSSTLIDDGNVAISIGTSFTNPDTVYVGKAPYISPMRIIRTTNGGTAWTDITNGVPDRYPLDIAVDPKNSRVVYVGLGGYESGHVFKSTDAGNSWADISGVLPDCPVSAVTVDPQNSNYVYIGTDIGVYVTTDGGGNWSNFSEGLPEAILVSDLTISPSNRTLRVVTHGNGVYERKMPALMPYLTLLQPNDPVTWDALGTHPITWDEGAVSLVRLDFSTDNGSTWSLIADNVSGSVRSYSWQVPFVFTSQAKVRITEVESPGLTSQSQNPFTTYLRGEFVTLSEGWNLLSVPITAIYPRIDSLFGIIPNCVLFQFTNAGYTTTCCSDHALPGTGYWVRAPQMPPLLMRGDSITNLTISVNASWNMVGSISVPIPKSGITADPATGIGPSSNLFAYRNGYVLADSIVPGGGYWIRSNAPGSMTLSSGKNVPAHPISHQSEDDSLNTLFIRDQPGRTMSLRFGISSGQTDKERYELPPVPPEGLFDIRFNSQQYAAIVTLLDSKKDFPIDLQSVEYPLHIRTTSAGAWSIVADDVVHSFTNRTEVVIEKPVRNLHLRYDRTIEKPLHYALYQNYPNPFNPSTEIQFEIPEKAHVLMKVYSMLGQEVATLVDEVREAGTGSVSWNAAGMASGVYIVRITAGQFSQARKILLVQ